MTISELAVIVAKIVGYEGKIVHDFSKPDGTPRKLVDSSKIFALGWRPEMGFEEGMQRTYEDFLGHKDTYLSE